jgi:5,10-methylenetetrahydromethanopterin reductase
VALYLPIVAGLDPTFDPEPEWLASIQAAVEEQDGDRAAALISDEILSKFAFAGTPDDIIEAAAGLFAAGADRIEFGTPHGLSTGEGLNLLGGRVLPALKAAIPSIKVSL